MRRLSSPFGLAALSALMLLLGFPALLGAHEIPSRVTVLAFVKPEGRVLRVVLRVPLEAMRDIDFPLRAEGYLDVARAQPLLSQAASIWLADYLTIREDGRTLTGARIAHTRLSIPSDRSFAGYETAVAHLIAPPLDPAIDLPWQQALLDVAIEYRISSDSAAFSIHPALAHLGIMTMTSLRFLPPGGAERAYSFTGDPGMVALDPRWHQAAFRFVRLGFGHILGGIDHLLFVLCLVIPIRRVRPLVGIVTSFTVAHSITLGAAALGFAPDALWFPPFIEVLVALSIVYMALENIVGARTDRRWIIAFGFGLVHGFAFSFTLGESMQFSGSHLVTALLAFNVGVELGQMVVLLVAVPALDLLFRHVVTERMGSIILSALIVHTAWHWMLERGSALGAYRFAWPVLDLAFAASAMRAAIVLIIAGLALWGLAALGSRLGRVEPERGVGAE